MELTPEQRASEDAGYWASIYAKIRLQKGRFVFAGREYLIEPTSSRFRRMCYMKGSQGGGSTVEILKSFHGMIYERLPGGVLYLFPTTQNMQDYSKAVMAPLIQVNRTHIGRYVKSVKGSSDAASLKTVNSANLFLRGGNLSQIIEGEGESSNLKSITCDKIVFDEIELMDKEVIAKALGRLGDSKVKEEVYIGNPGIPGRGIDEIFCGSKDFTGSDQRHWFRKCLHCGTYTCAEESFPDCVKIRNDGTGYIGCNKCGKEVFVRDGIWVPKYRDKSDYMHGYRWSHLTSPNHDPAEVLDHFINPPFGNLGDVYRLELGLPYISAESRLAIGQVLSRCGQEIMGTSDPGPCAFGLDVGKIKHLIIGRRTGQKSFEIVKLARLSKWDDISTMITRFNCRSGVIDAQPYEDEARRFQKEHPKIKIYLNIYSENTSIPVSYNSKTGVVTENRTEIFDSTHNLVASDGLLTIPRNCEEVNEFAKQVCDPAKVLEINKRTKQAIYRYTGKEDHYRNALNYFLLAAKYIGRSDVYASSQKYETVDNEYTRI